MSNAKRISELQEEIACLRREDQEQSKLANLKPVGKWRVTTEGDDEGRSVKTLGEFEGHIVDIAERLSGECYYSLTFKPVAPIEHVSTRNPQGRVSITLNIETGTWDMSPKRRTTVVASWIGSHPKLKRVSESDYHAAVTLEFKSKS